MARVTVTLDDSAAVVWDDGRLSGPPELIGAVVRYARAPVAVNLPGFGGGTASVASSAGQIVAAATMKAALGDDVRSLVFDPPIEPLPEDAIA